MLSWPGVFQFGTFLSVAFNVSKSMSASEPSVKKMFEERATICYSNYRVAGCKNFFLPTWSVAERDRAPLIGIGLAET